jgi:FtsP/CotA-like multicopper oxidase with cupredoxin domain
MKKYFVLGLSLFIIILLFTADFLNNNDVVVLDSGKPPEGREIFDLWHLKNATSTEIVLEKRYNFNSYSEGGFGGGDKKELYTYNGYPFGGLHYEVLEGQTIDFNVTNNLGEEDLVHFHGVRMENKYDGTHLVQTPIKSGETFAYKLNFSDPGFYWFHPHILDYYKQDLGMYGTIFVNPKNPDYFGKYDKKEIIILDDINLDKKGQTVSGKNLNHALMGEFGNNYLINGKLNGGYELYVAKNEKVLFAFLNAANSRTFQMSFYGGELDKQSDFLEFDVVGGDNGRVEKVFKSKNFIIAPSDRILINVTFDKEGVYLLEHIYKIGEIEKRVQLGKVTVTEGYEKIKEFSFKGNESDYREVRKYLNKPIDKEIELNVEIKGMEEMDHSMMNHGSEKIEWEDNMLMMNENVTAENTKWYIKDIKSGKMNDEIDYNFKKGEFTKFRIYNNLKNSAHPMQHPIHFHGNRFVVTHINGVQNKNLSWEDTFLVQNGDFVDIVLENSNIGHWMAHCHILEHLESGMFFNYKIYE